MKSNNKFCPVCKLNPLKARNVICEVCLNKSLAEVIERYPCTVCKGKGQLYKQQRTVVYSSHDIVSCFACKGYGTDRIEEFIAYIKHTYSNE